MSAEKVEKKTQHRIEPKKESRGYVDVLKLTEDCLPPREGLERLGLDFVVPILQL